jgi:hypothetical protein
LILAIHDPSAVVYFSDELYRWLVADGRKVKLLYSIKEYVALATQAKAFMTRINCTPIELEKVAFTIIKENEPVVEPKPPKISSGNPPGRPAKPDSEKKPKRVPTGLPRGRPRKEVTSITPSKRKAVAAEIVKASTGADGAKKRGRPTKTVAPPASGEKKKKRGRPAKATSATATPASDEKKRGRPSKSASATTASEPKKRGRPPKVEEPSTPDSSKRKTPASAKSSSAKRAKH